MPGGTKRSLTEDSDSALSDASTFHAPAPSARSADSSSPPLKMHVVAVAKKLEKPTNPTSRACDNLQFPANLFNFQQTPQQKAKVERTVKVEKSERPVKWAPMRWPPGR